MVASGGWGDRTGDIHVGPGDVLADFDGPVSVRRRKQHELW